MDYRVGCLLCLPGVFVYSEVGNMKDKKESALHLRLTQAERQTLERLARENGRKLSAVVRDLVQEALINRAIREGSTR